MSKSPAKPRSMNLPAPERMRIIRWVALGVIAWGIFHAIGAWRFNNNPLRAVVVLACVGAFLGFWMAMLAVRQRRLSKN
jgi:RsiW-degrading membrane proteinase PrsW (M82 family)